MAARCVNGHDTPNGTVCMYCGGPVAVAPPPVAPPQVAYAPLGPRVEGPRPYSATAIASLVVAIVAPLSGLLLPVFVGGIGSLVAVALALVALGQIRTLRQQGTGFAVAGLVVGILGILWVGVVFTANGIVEDPDKKPAGSATTTVPTRASCSAEARTIAVAATALKAQSNEWPTSVQQLVDVGYLKPGPKRFELQGGSTTTPPMVIGTGDCSGVVGPRMG